MLALVDESIVIAGAGCYLLACVVLPDDRRAKVRREVRRAAVGNHFHWKDEREDAQFRMLAVLAGGATRLFAHVRRPTVRREHEGVRATLLNALLDDLAKTTTLDLLLESRQRVNDLKDRQVIAGAVADHRISSDINYGHSGPDQEPLLWLADALAGAVMAQVRGDGKFVASLPPGLLMVR